MGYGKTPYFQFVPFTCVFYRLDPSLHFACCLLGATNSCQYHITGIPLGFVVIGLGTLCDEYGVQDNQGNLKY